MLDSCFSTNQHVSFLKDLVTQRDPTSQFIYALSACLVFVLPLIFQSMG
ncbi:SidA/IucD/PvdA family monooxygenase [Enterobacter sp. 9-2]|nr:lysine N(6)-hydroxylase/L-ornithine N(5)-oxygenase family protein [Pantoea sp. LS15]NKF45009.1 lysine N(6)-hydroxylase/L-ornithine N(5)-oxygenase family protein [Pantoea sp. LS15]QBC04957.1 hypothetical protein EWI30_11610 [Enterobacter cloacae]RDK16747.1 hypothetical protein CEJ32_02085 [Enterobacter sp. 9-2]